jgi:membrane-associated phospholipid phosphatase
MSSQADQTRPSNSWSSALALAVGQAAMFVALYGGCIALTASRPDVGRLYSSWELRIPLVPIMILPYFSIYPLFFTAFFICADQEERRTLAQRLTMSQLVAAACYLLFPLECGFQRPQIGGACGAMFRLLDATDLPFNLAPSLHVTTSVILGSLFAARARGRLLRLALTAWFTLIALSTLLTWQHHLVDVVSGALLGTSCLRFSPGMLRRFAQGRTTELDLRHLRGEEATTVMLGAPFQRGAPPHDQR